MRRVQVRCGRTTACVAGVLLAAIAAFAASAAVARTWKSKAGSYQVEADLVKVENGKVTLRKPGGETITVDESRLCDADRAYLHSGNSADAEDQSGKVVGEEAAPDAGTPVEKKKPRTFADLSAESNECAAADEVLALYKEFLADSSIDESELLAARNNLPIWQSRAEKKMVRFGTRWLESKEVRKCREKANGFLDEAIELIENKQFDKARKKLTDASRQDPESLRADFLSGLICLFGRRDIQSARQEFYECLKRQPKHVPSLNNLALVEVRLGKYNDAIGHWKRALAQGTASHQITQNLGRLMNLAEKRICPLPPITKQKVNDLWAGVSASAGNYDSQVGWLYMPFDHGEQPWIIPDKDMGGGQTEKGKLRLGEDRLCMHCGGSGQVKCPNPQCAQGTVAAGHSIDVVGTNGTATRSTPRPPSGATCPVCGGRGKVRCPDCVNGIDKTLGVGESSPTAINTPSRRRTR